MITAKLPSAKLPVAISAIAILGLTACTNPDGSNNNTGSGALIGAGLGAAAGAIVGGNGRSAALGGLIGGTVGLGIGAVLDEQQKDLERSLAGSGARIINTGSELIVSLPEAITFDTDSAEVKPGSRSNILAIADNLQEYPDSTVQVIGHTDNTGTTRYNQNLSVRRANAVADVLVSGGVRSNRVRAIGRGETQPIASNSTAAGRAENRRVEIVIIPTT